MSEQNTQFMNYIKENLKGDTQQNALSFVQYLISIGMTAGGSINDGNFAYKGELVCYTYFGSSSHNPGYPEPWTLWIGGDYGKELESVPFDDRMKEIAWANVHDCDNCRGTRCNPDERTTVFGRDFDNLCVSVFGFTDPNAEAVELAKKLMEMKKHTIDSKE